MIDAIGRCASSGRESGGLAAAQAKIAHLETALESSGTSGVAIGILMERLKIAPADAFDVLVSASQHEHLKLRDIASDLVHTGELGHVRSHEHGDDGTADKRQHAAARTWWRHNSPAWSGYAALSWQLGL
jgi:hypothetical protein